jgi:phosphate:Na+ symporter
MDTQTVVFCSTGGLALFLFGMNFMSEGLKLMGSESFKRILQSLTKNRGFAILAGMGITCLIQSSSATSVMVVGFVNARLLDLSQAIAVVLGADIGTTITAWLVSTMGIGEFKITVYALPIIAVGFLIFFLAKTRKRKMLGQAILGFGLLFLGLGFMSDGVKSIKESQMVMDLFESFGQNPFLGVLAGTAVTCLIQSSSATIAIVQVMAFQNLFGLDAALALMFGADIGTTITAQLAALGGTKGARGVAMANSVFKVFGAMMFMPLLVTGVLETAVVSLIPDNIATETGTNRAVMAQIAIAHTAYIAVNVVLFSTVLWPLLVRISRHLARIKEDVVAKEKARYLDPILLDTPPIALEQCYKEVAYMTRLCQKNITAAFACFIEKNVDRADEIEQREDRIDDFQSNITAYLAQLFRRRLSIGESRTVPRLIHCINDAERVGDHAENLVELTNLVIEKKLPISVDAKRDLHNYFDLVDQQFRAVIHALREKDAESVSRVIELEEEINSAYVIMSEHHVTRLNDGTCTVNTGVVFLDVIANLEKIADHLTNIAERVEIAPDSAGSQRPRMARDA